MQLIQTAKSIKFNKETDFKGQFVIEPLYPGYGLTVGNSLRRVLLSSIPGAAITSVKIKGVEHEFSTLEHIKEDIVEILLNIKQVNLSIEGKTDSQEPLVIKLKKTGETKVTAGDFKCPTQVNIANKDLHIATLTDKAASLEMECLVEKGMGYLPTENRSKEKLDIGHIAVDAAFTPINHVNIETENVRVGEMTNWDKLILSLETNGTITCQAAFDLAVQILCDQFNFLLQKEEKGTDDKEKVSLPLAEDKKEAQQSLPAAPEKMEEDKTESASEPSSIGSLQISDETPAEENSPALGSPDDVAEEKPKRKRGRPKKEDK
jgi:DNA-directed RNA polymerase subunit alpha